ncbi:FtsP/CotA-like multicopper oxidase with cupredoxin domain [Streptacidiphilus sp. MAP12-20]|uniref:multicopper oxidase family protein n=1 Tax=Streptacidiphilus sp. MAP12-20 TaxID=3156299 RepID=UPI00351281B5
MKGSTMAGQISRRGLLGAAGALTATAALIPATDLLAGVAEAEAEPIGGPGVPSFRGLTPFLDKLRIPPVLRPSGDRPVEVRLMNASIRLHSQLPKTPLWTYEGSYPGPTIEVKRGRASRIVWTNTLTGTMPVSAALVPMSAGNNPLIPAGLPGRGGVPARTDIASITPWTVTHLHGGFQHAGSDGYAENAVTPGGSQLSEYTNDQAATQLFYHDHAMDITAVNVMAGLLGNYLVRDTEEAALDLPSGRYEIPLTITDVNFDTDDSGRLTGVLLAKRLQATAPSGATSKLLFLGPYTMVNGVVWPYLDVEARWYRFRTLNASNGRGYVLALVDEATGAVIPNALQVIGNDGGLLDKPVAVSELPITSAERYDVLIDFSKLRGKRVKLVNVLPGVPAGVPVPGLMPYPDVMRFVVGSKQVRDGFTLPQTLSSRFVRVKAEDATRERFVLTTVNADGMPELWELTEVAATASVKIPSAGVVQFTDASGTTRTFQRSANRFEQEATIYTSPGAWEKWTFISDAAYGAPILHPMHIHLINFQIVSRQALNVTPTFNPMDFVLGGTTQPIRAVAPLPIAPYESGWKDVVSVPNNTAVTVVGQFGQQTGRFMYHCHILDHEDDGMMRPMMLMPPAVLAYHEAKMAAMPGGGMPPMPGM